MNGNRLVEAFTVILGTPLSETEFNNLVSRLLVGLDLKKLTVIKQFYSVCDCGRQYQNRHGSKKACSSRCYQRLYARVRRGKAVQGGSNEDFMQRGGLLHGSPLEAGPDSVVGGMSQGTTGPDAGLSSV